MAVKKIKVGSRITIPAGTRVTRAGTTAKRAADSTVTVRAVEQTKKGLVVSWKSCGLKAQTILKLA